MCQAGLQPPCTGPRTGRSLPRRETDGAVSSTGQLLVGRGRAGLGTGSGEDWAPWRTLRLAAPQCGPWFQLSSEVQAQR